MFATQTQAPLSLKQQQRAREIGHTSPPLPRNATHQSEATIKATEAFGAVHSTLRDIRRSLRTIEASLRQQGVLLQGTSSISSSPVTTQPPTRPGSRNPSRQSSYASDLTTPSRTDSRLDMNDLEPDFGALRNKVQAGLSFLDQSLAVHGLEKLRESLMMRFAELTAEISDLEVAFWQSRQERMRREGRKSKRMSRMFSFEDEDEKKFLIKDVMIKMKGLRV